MKYGLLVTSPISEFKNIGDYVQTLAALQFTPNVDTYIEKEEASADLAVNEQVKSIMNAWYIWHPENWPPHKKITPLLTSVHMSPLTAEAMVKGDKRNYMMENGPIGCRDLDTLKFLQSKDIPSYFSGCLTLTLGRKYKSTKKREGIVFVDPYISPLRDLAEGKFVYYYFNVLKSLFYFLKYPSIVLKLSKKKYFHQRLSFMKYYNAAMFYNAYKTKFSKSTLLNSKYLTHIVPVEKNESQESLLKRSEELLNLYATSSLVVTSRIHCALPCLGVETPVIFVVNDKMNSKKNLFNAPGRFAGIIEFFRVLKYSTDEVLSNDDVINKLGKIDSKSTFKNKKNYIEYRDALTNQCEEFIKSN
jgi:hypothetical protein